MKKPSSTITAATLAGMAIAVVWEVIATFTEFVPTPGLISSSTALVSGLVGYYKRENVLPVKRALP